MPTKSEFSGFAGSVSKLVPLLIVSNAARLARAGKYADAESLISQLNQEDKAGLGALDLLARIRAQQGRFREAEDLWLQLSKLDPGNERYSGALRRIQHLHSRPAWLSAALAAMICLIFAGSATLVIVKVRSYVNQLQETARRPVHASADRGTTSVMPKQSTSSAWKGPDIRVPGVNVRREHDRVVLAFHAGLFGHGVVFRLKGSEALTEVTRRLALYRGPLSIVLVGCSDGLPPRPNSGYRDNVALGMARANTVYARMTMAAGLRGDIFSLRSATGPPCPSNPSRRDLRSRTVVIQVFPGQYTPSQRQGERN